MVGFVRDGAPISMAAKATGMSEATLYAALAADPEVSRAVEKARAEAMIRRIKRIEGAGKEGTWQADAWYLERQNPSEFALRQRIEHTGKDGERLRLVWPWEVNASGSTDRNASAAPESGNGRPVNGTVPGHRLRAQVGENGSK